MKPQPVYTFAKWKVKEGRLDTVLALLAEMATKTKTESGNLFYKIHQDIADTHTILLFEGYTDRSAVEAHRNATYFQELVVEQIIPELQGREVILASEIHFDLDEKTGRH